jgi:hypothetical protein
MNKISDLNRSNTVRNRSYCTVNVENKELCRKVIPVGAVVVWRECR